MLPFKKILFPVDYSPSCIAMVPYVTDMARHFSAELLVIHAYALRPMFVNHDFEGSMVYADLGDDPQRLEETGRPEALRLREFAARMFPGLGAETMAEEGEAGSVIHRVLAHQGADLVMLPTRGA